MEFNCEKKELQSAVATVEKLVATRSVLPIIANILFEVEKGGVKLSANNLEMGIEITIKASVAKEGSFLLPAKTLSGMVSKLPEGKVNFKLNENKTIKISYSKSSFNLHSLPPDEFPALAKVKEGKDLKVEADQFVSMVRHTIFAVSNSEEKHSLTGVLLETGKNATAADSSNFRMIATDGYRLAKSSAKLSIAPENGLNVIVPARALNEMARIADAAKAESLQICFSGEHICFRCEGAFLVSRIIQGQFPDYRQVLPKKSTTNILLKTNDFLKAAERAAVIASGSANVTSFEVKQGKLLLAANTPDVGSVEEELEAEIKGNEKTRVSFNIRLVIDALGIITEEKVFVELTEGLGPGIIRPENQKEYLYLVMPIRTQEAV